MGEPFKVGDAVYLVSYDRMWNAKPGVVKSVYKNGNFTIEGDAGQFRQGGGRAGDAWQTLHAHLATPEMATKVAEAKAQRAARSFIFEITDKMRTFPADRHAAIAALLSDELLALLGVTR